MIRVVIVDDEPFIRFGIKASIDWKKEGLLVTGEFANGAEALEFLQSEPAEILITDIKMPVMDGLQLIRQALAVYPHLKIILVSSHNDFVYVREGLKLGVVDYILKHTLEPEELLQVVRNCRELIVEEEQLQERLQSARDVELLRKRKLYEQELKRFLIDKTDTLFKDHIPGWIEHTYTAVYVTLNRVRAIEEMYGFLHKSIVLEQFMDEFYKRFPLCIALSTAESELFFLIPTGELEVEQLSTIRSKLEQETGASATFGYECGAGSGAIKACFNRSKEACWRGFFEGEGVFPYKQEQPWTSEGAHLPGIVQASPYLNDEQLDEMIERWKAGWIFGGASPAVLKEQANRVLSNLFKHYVDPYLLVESFDRLVKSESLDELCVLLKEQIAELQKQTAEHTDAQPSDNPVDKALEYIRLHYAESLTLQQVADVVHVSKNYFSILFKKTTGHNFIDYVIQLRVQKAKELLADTALKIYEVAEQSGFNDVKYFSKLFKKISGLSPVDYREYYRSNRDDPKRGES
ncbi:response regulator [Paenibacillus abyssi]|uniref:DNA-binding response regulator n=1 Tax=Paenibacillus abyssi TaxID=1340531 RepID=A0A917CY96_9BACL|nr:response regulator [Paenibacillus abyssi]GGG04168.1 DNA-binding response regulator [Paenibacillus abyssi]